MGLAALSIKINIPTWELFINISTCLEEVY